MIPGKQSVHPPIQGPAQMWTDGKRMGVYRDDGDGTFLLDTVYTLTPDGWRIVVDPIPQLEAEA